MFFTGDRRSIGQVGESAEDIGLEGSTRGNLFHQARTRDRGLGVHRYTCVFTLRMNHKSSLLNHLPLQTLNEMAHVL